MPEGGHHEHTEGVKHGHPLVHRVAQPVRGGNVPVV